MTAARLAVDIGGTFTDIVLEHDRRLVTAKVLTTPAAPEQAFLAGMHDVLEQAGLAPVAITTIIHGTTLATNALIERKGALTALLTTAGFRDSLEIGYEARYDQYDLNLERIAPLVPRERRFPVGERTSANGVELAALDEAAVVDACEAMRAGRVESVAIGFLHAYADPRHELLARDIVTRELPGVSVCVSSEVCPEIREYERLSTTVANAYVRPTMARYLASLEQALQAAGVSAPVFLVTSAGGVTTLANAIDFPIRLVESGPSGGAVLAARIARERGETRVLSYDMGGTTAKICLIDEAEAMLAREFEAARTARFHKGSGLPLRIPVVEMIEIGAGGGSIAGVDQLQRITVGPDSAGADPGPACYARGGRRTTVTDADLLLGRIDATRFAEGRVTLDQTAAADALERDLQGKLDLERGAAALAITEMVDETMANAARVHAAEQGADLGEYTLIGFGGAGPLHAGRLAQKLGIRRWLIPPDPGVASAVGFLSMPLACQVVRSHYMTLSRFDPSAVANLFEELLDTARKVVLAASPEGDLQVTRSALMRYRGQGHEISVELDDDTIGARTAANIRTRYGDRYRELYGRELPDGEIEILTWMLSLSTPAPTPVRRASAERREHVAVSPTSRAVYAPHSDTFKDTPVVDRTTLQCGDRLDGPLLVVESQTTTLVPDGFRVTVDDDATLVIEGGRAQSRNRVVNRTITDVELQLVWNRLQSIVDEQAGILMRTAFSPIVRESGDLSAGVFDVEGHMLAQAVTGTPGHVNTMAAACRNFFEHFPRNAMRAGDIYLTNDPWLGAGHLNDFMLVKPCFHDDRLVALLSCTSHLVDIGGRCLGPDGADVFDEGLYIPPIKLVDAGVLNQTLLALLKANSRSPRQAEGDLFALVACSEKGAERVSELVNEFALMDFDAVAERILTTSEAGVRQMIAALDDGQYDYTMTVDGFEAPITIEARLDISGNQIALDFRASSTPSRHGINVPLNYTQAYSVFGLKCAIAPEVPNNHGSLLPFVVTAAEGTILNARKPAPVASRHILGQLLPDVALGCLHALLPDSVPAEGAATLWDLPMKGVDPHSPDGVFAAELVFNGGTGARPGKDGLSATAYPSGVMGSQVEVTESTTPVLIRRREYRPDSGGAGTTRGGLGQSIEIEALEGVPLTLYGTVDRVIYPARGRRRGADGATGRFTHSGGTHFTGKGALVLTPGERLLVQTPGGGGYGDPAGRSPEHVARDVAQGLVSIDVARECYRVALNAAGEVDHAATRRLRDPARTRSA